MKKQFTLLTLCMLFAAFFFVPVTLHAAPATASESAKSTGTESEVSPAPGWSYKNGSYIFYYVEESNVQQFTKTAMFHFKHTTTYKDETGKTLATFPAGLYYLNKGKLHLSSGSISTIPVYYPKKDGSLTLRGTYRIDKKAPEQTTKNGQVTFAPKANYFTGQSSNKVYLNGEFFNGIACDTNQVYYKVTDGVYAEKYTGIVNKKYIDASLKRLCNPSNKCYKNGKPFTGIYKNKYYKNAVLSDKTGWIKYNNGIYYLKKGAALTGTHYLPSYGGGSKKYRYTFFSDGTLNRNLLKNSKTDYRKGKLKFEVNITTHTITMLAYDSHTKSYDIPVKAFICSTSRKRGGTKTGNFYISSKGRARWFVPPKATHHFYQWGTFIHGSYSWFHSEIYRSKNIRNFNAKSYNQLGTNQTTACVRMQVVNSRMIYSLAGSHSRIPVQIFRSPNKGAFGQIKLEDTTGKIPTSQKYDPTDPAIKKK